MNKRKILWAVLMLGLLGMLAGCRQEKEIPTAETAQKETKMQIGLSFDSFVIERWVRDRDVFVDTAKELGAEVNVQNANGNVQEQISQIEYLIEKKMDVIVIVAGDCNALTNVVKKAKDQGIPVISYDRLIQNADCDLYISFDNVEVGRLMAQNLMESIPEGGKIAMVQGPLEDDNVAKIKEGFESVIKNSNLEIVYEANCEGWLAENAFTYTNEALKAHDDLKGIMCGNDDLASYAFRALAERQLAGKIALVGQDGELAACQRIVEGTQNMTVHKSIDEQARIAAQYAVQMAKGEKPEVDQVISDGTYEVPFYMMAPIAVTEDNMDEIIIDEGFHLKEDVYLNTK